MGLSLPSLGRNQNYWDLSDSLVKKVKQLDKRQAEYSLIYKMFNSIVP